MPRTGPRTYLRRTNKCGTCLWCGRNIVGNRGYGMAKRKKCELAYNFCSLVCTEHFAVAMVKNGFILTAYEGPVHNVDVPKHTSKLEPSFDWHHSG